MSPRFEETWEDGDFTSDPAWTIYQSEGNFEAKVVTQDSPKSPDGGSNLLSVTETTGGGTAGIIGWVDKLGGWNQEWTLEGLFYAPTAPTDTPFQYHAILPYYDPETDTSPIQLSLGFTTGNGSIRQFEIGGDLVGEPDESYDPQWEADTWFWYEVHHDGNGNYTGRIWTEERGRPADPDVRSTGDAPGTDQRVTAIEINGARGAPIEMRHDYMNWHTGGNLEARMTTLAFIPGESEDGTPLRSATMQVFPDSDFFPTEPLFDSWFTGDYTAELEESLSEATAKKKVVEEFPNDSMHQYRHKDQIEITCRSPDGQTIEDESVKIVFNDGEPAREPPAEVSFLDEEQSYTMLEKEDMNALNDYVDDWFDGFKRHRAVRMPRHWTKESFTTANGIEGVRVMSVSGSYDWYAEKLAEVVADKSAKSFLTALFGPIGNFLPAEKLSLIYDYLIISPKVFTVQELVILADGRRAGRLWDASAFPRHSVYLGGNEFEDEKWATTDFEKGDEWEPTELLNQLQISWMVEAQTSARTPYETLPSVYMAHLIGDSTFGRGFELPLVSGNLNAIVPEHPLLSVGADNSGENLVDEDISSLLRTIPANPFE